MIISVFPVAAFAAEDAVEVTAEYLADNGYVLDGSAFTVNDALVIPSDKTLVLQSGILNVYGSIDVKGKLLSTGGILVAKCFKDEHGVYQHGAVFNSQNIVADSTISYSGTYPGLYCAEVVFEKIDPEFSDINCPDTTFKKFIQSAEYGYSWSGSFYDDLLLDDHDGGRSWKTIWNDPKYDASFSSVVYVPLNQYMYFSMSLMGYENGKTTDKYDSTKMPFTFNGRPVENLQGRNNLLVTSGGVVEFKKPTVKSTDMFMTDDEALDRYMRKAFSVYLASGAGYQIFGVSGEATANTETVKLVYGTDFAFRLDLDKEYSKSDYKVYAVNSYKFDGNKYSQTLEEASASADFWDDEFTVIEFDGDRSDGIYVDENGVYHISGSRITRDFSICVEGVVKDETVSFAGRILQMLRNIINTIKGFFDMLFNR